MKKKPLKNVPVPVDQPGPEEWRKLYEAAGKVKEMAPWNWMMEDEVFGVQNPETGETGYVSVMGHLGEHLGISVYMGDVALYKFFDLEDAADDEEMEEGPMTAMLLLEIPQLQASFEDRELLDKDDLAVIKQLGLKFRGPQAWPQFRAMQPAMLPWYITAAEARYLTCVLEQLPDVALRFDDDDELLYPDDADGFLIRVAREENGARVWEDVIRQVPRPEPAPIRLNTNMALLEKVSGFRQVSRDLEMELMMMPMPTADKGQRPCFPYLLMIVDETSGMIVKTDLMAPTPSLEAMWGDVPNRMMSTIEQLGAIPGVVRVRSSLLMGLLQPLSLELGFQLKHADELPALDEAMDMLMDSPMFN
ncbi:MAG: DUF6930 domain-containing protein [Blastocatellia bacterium]